MPISVNRLQYDIICESKQERKAVLDALIKVYGYKWHGSPVYTSASIEREWPRVELL